MAIHRVTSTWQGFTGAPGYSNFFFSGGGGLTDATEDRARVVAFFQALITMIPSGVTVRTEPEVAVIDQANGQVESFLNIDTPAQPVIGTGAGGFSSASGAVVNWLTAGVRNGRRVSGRTFIVPLANGGYQSDGTLTPAALTALQNAGNAMIGTGFDSRFGVWSRPSGAASGLFWEATGHRIVDKVAVLRSRRD